MRIWRIAAYTTFPAIESGAKHYWAGIPVAPSSKSRVLSCNITDFMSVFNCKTDLQHVNEVGEFDFAVIVNCLGAGPTTL